jgi:hypothetical protein
MVAQIEAIMREVCRRLDEYVRLVKDWSATIEFQDYRCESVLLPASPPGGRAILPAVNGTMPNG